MNKTVKEYWPEYYGTILEFLELSGTEDIELDDLEEAVGLLFDDQFVLTAGYEAVKRREKMLGIQADSTTETLDFRRKRIINRYSTKPPFTLRYLQERLDFLVGKDKAVTSVDSQDFILFVRTAIENAMLFQEVERTVKTIKPANLVYNQQTALNAEVRLEEHASWRRLERKTRLRATWYLGSTPFAVAGAEVNIK